MTGFREACQQGEGQGARGKGQGQGQGARTRARGKDTGKDKGHRGIAKEVNRWRSY